jgi:hypothetical protein
LYKLVRVKSGHPVSTVSNPAYVTLQHPLISTFNNSLQDKAKAERETSEIFVQARTFIVLNFGQPREKKKEMRRKKKKKKKVQ